MSQTITITHVRFTKAHSPMSTWGHAMFVQVSKWESVKGYGDVIWGIDASTIGAVSVGSLRSVIDQRWGEDVRSDASDLDPQTRETLLEYDGEEDASDMFNPDDIVDSALAWDNSDLMVWLWERVLEPAGILAVLTEDGAIVFDKKLITRIPKRAFFDAVRQLPT